MHRNKKNEIHIHTQKLYFILIKPPNSLPRRRFLDVTQRSPKETAADIRTTFLSPNWPITARVPFLGTFSRQTHRFETRSIRYRFFRDPHVEKYHKQHKTNGGA